MTLRRQSVSVIGAPADWVHWPSLPHQGAQWAPRIVEAWEVMLKPTTFTRLAVLALFAAGCQLVSQPAQPTAMIPPQPLAATWPAFGEGVDAAPVLQWQSFPGATHYQVTVLDDDAVLMQQDTT